MSQQHGGDRGDEVQDNPSRIHDQGASGISSQHQPTSDNTSARSQQNGAYRAFDRKSKIIEIGAAIIIGGLLVLVASLQACANYRQVQIARAQQRPWVFGEVSVDQIVFNETLAANISVSLVLKNTGASPASDVVSKLAIDIVSDDNAFDTRAMQDDACKKATGDSGGRRGISLFPSDKKTQTIGVVTDPTKYAKSIAGAENISFWITGCIDYRYAFEPETHGITSFAYIITMPADGGVHRSGIKPIAGRQITGEQLAIDPDFFHGGRLE